MDIEKLQKFYKLASNNPNKNEAAIAALKFIENLEKEGLNIQLYKGNPPLTEEQIKQALQDHFNAGYQKGKADTENRYRKDQIVMNTTSSNTISFGTGSSRIIFRR